MSGPRLLTRAEFQRHPASKKPGASYTGYLRFVAKRRGARLGAAAADPLAPTPEPVLRQQAAEAVRAQVDPLLKNIMADTDRTARGISLATGTYARQLEPYAGQTRERFDRAEEETAGVAEALNARLTGSGAAAATGLREKLAAINAGTPIENELAGGVETFANGAANAGFAVDSAALEELISRGVGAEDFSAALPGFAGMEGRRAIGDVRAAGQRSLGEVRGKVPGLVAELLNKGRDREVTKAIAKQGLQETQLGLAADQQQATYQASLPDSSLSNSLGYLVDERGVPILGADGNPIPTQSGLDEQKGRESDRKDALKARSDAVVAAHEKARALARELYKGTTSPAGSGRGRDRGRTTVTRKTRAEATQLILNEIAPRLARYGVTPGSKMWAQVRGFVIDALTDAGYPTGAAADPTKAKPRGPAEQKPRGG